MSSDSTGTAIDVRFFRDPRAVDYRMPDPMNQVADEWEGQGKRAYPCLALRLGVSWGFQVYNRFTLDFDFQGYSPEGYPLFNCTSRDCQEFVNNTGDPAVKVAEPHPPEQWINGLPIIKIELPFWIKTSAGTGLWVKALPNVHNPHFNVIEGFVESDTKKAFFPYKVMIELKGTESFSIEAHQPIAQYVPFRMYDTISYEQEDMTTEDYDAAYKAFTSVSMEKSFYRTNAKVQRCPMHHDKPHLQYGAVESTPLGSPNDTWED